MLLIVWLSFLSWQGPNFAVLDQWEETLILAGVDPNKIIPYRFEDDNVLAHVDRFILLTIHNMMSEMKNIIIHKKPSNLFPHFPLQLVNALKNVIKGKIKDRRKGETDCSYFTRVMERNMDKLSMQPLFRTFLIDEGGSQICLPRTYFFEITKLCCFSFVEIAAHFLKNLKCYWGMFATCLGVVSDKFNEDIFNV